MVIAEAAAGLTSIRTALDLLKALNDVSNAAVRSGPLLDLQKELFAAYSAQALLLERNRVLENRVMELESWEREKQRYELKALAPNVVAYAQKAGVDNPEPAHYLCANCYSASKKSFLQQHVRGSSVDMFKCNACGQELTVDKDPSPIRHRNDPGGSWQSY